MMKSASEKEMEFGIHIHLVKAGFCHLCSPPHSLIGWPSLGDSVSADDDRRMEGRGGRTELGVGG